MTEQTSLSVTPFAWVHKRDGRLVPFDADKICRALFATSEGLGRSDAFLAREMTDSVVHFLRTEASGPIPTTAQIAELVVKVVRELGQPALASSFAEAQARKAESGKQAEEDHRPSQIWKGQDSWSGLSGQPDSVSRAGLPPPNLSQWIAQTPAPEELSWQTASACLCSYSLQEIFSRDLVAAQAAGLLTLTGLESPLELGGYVLANPGMGGLGMVQALMEARAFTGAVLAIDGPEHRLTRQGTPREAAREFNRALRLGLRFTHLQIVLNLNSATPPPWAEELAVGPLFVRDKPTPDAEPVAAVLEELLEEWATPQSAGLGLRVDWHLGRQEFANNNVSPALVRLARRALEGAPIAFVFDRPSRPIALAEGLDRRHASLLLGVGLHLPSLAQQTGARSDVAVFLKKIGSLARLALSAAIQKRDFLRRHAHRRADLTRGFLLDRARLVIAPVGLEATAHALCGHGLCAGPTAPEVARQIVLRLQEVLREDGQAHALDAGIDSCFHSRLVPANLVSPDRSSAALKAEEVAGLTAWDASAPPKAQLRAANPLHAVTGTGTAFVLISEEQMPTAEDVVDWLRFAWQQNDLVRVRFVRAVQPVRQLTAPWE